MAGLEDRSGRERGAVYDRFSRQFFGERDKVYTTYALRTIGDMLRAMQMAFKTTLKEQASELERIGITPHLLLDGTGRASPYISFQSRDEIDIGAAKLEGNADIARILAGKSEKPYAPAQIDLQFAKSPTNFRQTIVAIFGRNSSLSLSTVLNEAGFEEGDNLSFRDFRASDLFSNPSLVKTYVERATQPDLKLRPKEHTP